MTDTQFRLLDACTVFQGNRLKFLFFESLTNILPVSLILYMYGQGNKRGKITLQTSSAGTF